MKKCYLTDNCIYLSENKDETFLESEIEKLYELYPNIPVIKTSIDNCLQKYSKLM